MLTLCPCMCMGDMIDTYMYGSIGKHDNLLHMNGIVLALALIIGCDLHATSCMKSMDKSEGDAPTYSP